MLTINRIKALDTFLHGLIDAVYKAMLWLQHKQDDAVSYLAYKAAERASLAVHKAENKIMDLEDERVAVGSTYIEAVNVLKDKYRALEQALTDAHAAKVDAINSELAEASLRMMTLEDRYDEVVAEARDKLWVNVDG